MTTKNLIDHAAQYAADRAIEYVELASWETVTPELKQGFRQKTMDQLSGMAHLISMTMESNSPISDVVNTYSHLETVFNANVAIAEEINAD